MSFTRDREVERADRFRYTERLEGEEMPEEMAVDLDDDRDACPHCDRGFIPSVDGPLGTVDDCEQCDGFGRIENGIFA